MREWDASLAKANGESSEDALSVTRSKSQPNIKLVQQAVKVSIEQTKLAGRIAKVYGELHEQGEIESWPQLANHGCYGRTASALARRFTSVKRRSVRKATSASTKLLVR